MTALSLNLSAAVSSENAGLPLEGLPPLEAGRTLPQAFAQLLGQAVGTGGKGAGDPQETSNAEAGDTAVLRPASKGAFQNGQPGADPLATTGKALPQARPETAGLEANGRGHVPGLMREQLAANGEADVGSDKPVSREGAETGILPESDPSSPTADDAETRSPEAGAQGESEQAQLAPVSIVAQLVAPTAGAPLRAGGAIRPEAGGGPASRPVTAAALATTSDSAVAKVLPGTSGFQNIASQEGGDLARGDGGGSEEAPSGNAERQTAQRTSAAQPAKNDRDGAQTGMSLHIRAAERPASGVDQAQPALLSAGSNAGATPASATSPLAAPLPGSPSAAAPLGVATPSTPLPHFPELAALVDRIAAARDSAGSASATIAVAHKELGKLSLTFETSGRTLDVEVAAQDSETQRSVAAAIAADRPQLRGSEAQATGSAQNQGTQSGTSGAGAEPGARQSGDAGASQSDRREQSRQGRNPSSAGDPQGQRNPKSDGGIYA